MKDSNYLKERNAKSIWHPMAHPADSLNNPPTIVTDAEGTRISDVDGHQVVDAVGGLWNVNLGYSCAPVKAAISNQLDRLTLLFHFSRHLERLRDRTGRYAARLLCR
jgi:adenosylmethionine-8-amino-7-oxononanoate aminotransferase